MKWLMVFMLTVNAALMTMQEEIIPVPPVASRTHRVKRSGLFLASFLFAKKVNV